MLEIDPRDLPMSDSPKAPSGSAAAGSLNQRAWNKVVIVGPGLIGASIGLALKRAGAADSIIGVSRRQETLDAAREVGAIDSGTKDLETAVAGANAVIVCTPVRLIADQVVRIARLLQASAPDDAWITDAGSSKASIVRAVEESSHEIPFVGSHPIAGSEQSGPLAGRVDLYDGRMVIVTPTEHTGAERLAEIESFWQCLGARVRRMTPDDHDRTLAATSHIPHLVATALSAATRVEDLPYTGTGWGSTTRIAAGEPELWCDILLDNQAHALKSLTIFEQQLSAIRDALERRDVPALKHLLSEGKKQRDSLGS